MKRIYTFKCSKESCQHIYDDLVEYELTHNCPRCGSSSNKVVNAPMFKLEGITGAYPTAYDAWERKRKQKLAEEQKRNAANS
jgi:hypothetical protein